ncbi:MAG: glycosyltransferase family 4 protein, partial [Sphingomonadales bacterium]|nr:glycosyltransferase family 4 protein [Sphingomonadales bacterium]
LLVGPTEAEARAASSPATPLPAITALGKVPYKELPSVLPAADLFLLPYPNKIVNVGRWPNKIGDYMAVGRPTVANPVGELNELFQRFPGRLAGRRNSRGHGGFVAASSARSGAGKRDRPKSQKSGRDGSELVEPDRAA